MIFDEFSQDSKKATVKTLLAISELCNSIILNDLADGTNLLEEIDPKEMFNGEKLLDSIKRQNKKRTIAHEQEVDEELDKMAEEIFNKPRNTTKNTNSLQKTRTFTENNEKLHLANDNDGEGDEWVCNEPSVQPDDRDGEIFNSTYIPITEMSKNFTDPERDTESVDDDSNPLFESEEDYSMEDSENLFSVVEVPAEEADSVDDEPYILKFNPSVLKDEPNQMFLGLDENHESFTWDMDNFGYIKVLGDTIDSESKVGKLLADYAFNNKKTVELKIFNPEVGNTSYLNYRTGEKAVSSNLKSVLKTVKETNEIILSRYEKYSTLRNNTINSVRDEDSRIILWVEEIDSYIPLKTDSLMVSQTKKEILEHFTSLIRKGRGAKVNIVLKSSQNLSNIADSEEGNFDFPTPAPIILYSKDSLHNNQIEIPLTSVTAQQWFNAENRESNEILAYTENGFKIVNLMESHRTSTL